MHGAGVPHADRRGEIDGLRAIADAEVEARINGYVNVRPAGRCGRIRGRGLQALGGAAVDRLTAAVRSDVQPDTEQQDRERRGRPTNLPSHARLLPPPTQAACVAPERWRISA